MKFYIEFDNETEKEIIDYLKSMDREEKSALKETLKYRVYKRRQDEIDREEQEKERSALWEKQRSCKHDFKERYRDKYDDDGEPYCDGDGEYQVFERVEYVCSKCEEVRVKFEGSNPWSYEG